ncbi:hypothetical protein FQR65_LT16456 [Abscondita terminalis]|nr:hypothetical protein FQR65_LT16456 [Abscondita terminalis]
MKNVEEFLNKKVIGQPESISKVSKVLYKAYTGLSGVAYSATKNKPKGTLFFVGPTGVGKTELAKAITTFLFGDESNLIRFDMSEYGQDNSDQKLIGAPPGYVGFEGGGQLTNAVKEKPFSVILFDEIEKASPKIFDKFLQILEDGRLTDNTGQTINFSETFIIFTSNIGASVVSPSDDKDQVYKQFLKEVQNHFTNELNRPELLGRFGNNIIPFNFISDIKLQARIVASKLKPIQLAIYNKYQVLLELDLNNSQILKTILKDVDIKRGGRDVINSLETNLTGPLSEFIFKNLPNMKSEIEGPGKRMVIWFQGCNIGCKGCSNQELLSLEKKLILSVDQLIQLTLLAKERHKIEGVTLLGGDPFLQPEGLLEFVKLCKANNLSVICFTGYIYEKMLEEYSEILKNIDILIDGPFIISKLDYKRRLIGSTNQRVLKLTDVYKENDYFEKPHSQFEIQVFNDRIHVNGDGVVFDNENNQFDMKLLK